MNTLLTTKAMKTDSPFKPYSKQHGKGHTGTYALLGAALLMTFSASTLANRPAMEERLDDAIAAEVNNKEIADDKQAAEIQEEVAPEAATEPRPAAEPEAPSAVEIMMQTQQPQQQSGDVLQLPATELQAGETIRIKLLDEPRRGMDMTKVQQLFGQPLATTEGVGKPPISSWTYSDRIVYFEYSTVLHVVAR